METKLPYAWWNAGISKRLPDHAVEMVRGENGPKLRIDGVKIPEDVWQHPAWNEGDGPISDATDGQMLDAVARSLRLHLDLQQRLTRLRSIIDRVAKNLGGFTGDETGGASEDFLEHVPDEAKIVKLQRDSYRIERDILTDLIARGEAVHGPHNFRIDKTSSVHRVLLSKGGVTIHSLPVTEIESLLSWFILRLHQENDAKVASKK